MKKSRILKSGNGIWTSGRKRSSMPEEKMVRMVRTTTSRGFRTGK
jgi:hypothetical protein